jgi:hypothetical protein
VRLAITERGTRRGNPSSGVHFIEEAQGALDHRAVFQRVVAPPKAAVGQQRLGN